jgi:hypothetical protein
MNCPNCNTPIDDEMQACLKCGAEVIVSHGPDRLHRVALLAIGRMLWKVAKLFLLAGISYCIFIIVYIVAHSDHMLNPNLSATASRGKDIHQAIIGANEVQKSLGLPSIWPKTCLISTNSSLGISSKIFKTSTEYFSIIYDETNLGTTNWLPAVKGFAYSQLAAKGVPVCQTNQTLKAKNNAWLIAANISDEDDDRIPVLITRNVDMKEIELVVNQGLKKSEFEKKITIGKGAYKTPFGKKGFALVRKGGGTLKQARKATLGDIFDNKELPPRDPAKPPIVYLMP